MAKGSQQPQVTEVKTPPSRIFKEYTPLSVLAAYNEANRNQQERVDYESARRDQASAGLLGQPYTGTFNFQGEKVDPTRTPEPFDLTYAFDPERNPYYADELEFGKRQLRKQRERRQERMEKMDEVDTIFGMPRDKYLSAINRVRQQ
jgi:hypothetical protein